MILDILGFKRVAFIAILLAVNVVVALALYFYVQPQSMQAQLQLNGLRNAVAKLDTDISNLQLELGQLEEQQETFEELKKSGFFDSQGRRQAELLFKEIQERSGVDKAEVSVSGGEIEENEDALKAGHKILKSEISIRIRALNDISVFHYIHLVKKLFPGHVSLSSIELKRDGELNETVLRGFATGKTASLVNADLKLTWRTMIPEDRVIGGAS